MGVLIIKDGEYPEFTPEQEAMLTKLAAMDDRDIDTSDIPELGDDFWRQAQRGHFRHREQLTIGIDRAATTRRVSTPSCAAPCSRKAVAADACHKAPPRAPSRFC